MRAKPTDQDIENFASVAATALVRTEVAGRIPPRFTDGGPELWMVFRNESTKTDLLDLAVRDTAVAMPQPFALDRLWPGASGDELCAIPPAEVTRYIAKAIADANKPMEVYLQAQAGALRVPLPPTEAMAALPNPEAHHRILELPGSGGWLAFYMTSRPEVSIYYWENFTIACGTWQEQLLAGLIAFELGAPPHRYLPIVHDPSLEQVLNEDAAFDWIVGLRAENARRADALRSFLRPEGQVVLL